MLAAAGEDLRGQDQRGVDIARCPDCMLADPERSRGAAAGVRPGCMGAAGAVRWRGACRHAAGESSAPRAPGP